MKKVVSVIAAFCLLSLAGSLQAGEVQTSQKFTLGPGDVLQISVWKDEALTREVLVRPDGKFSFPLAGEIEAAGRTIEEVHQDLEARLKKYVPDSPVTVILSQLKSTRIFVVGKVQNPGMFIVQGETSVIQALALAGGLGRFADKDDIYVLRRTREGQQALFFNYSEVSSGDDLRSNIDLKPGDTVVVP